MPNHTVLQGRLLDSLKQLERSHNMVWEHVVTATNELSEAIERGDEVGLSSASFPPDVLKAMDFCALQTAWMYARMEGIDSRVRRDTQKRLRKALGYSG